MTIGEIIQELRLEKRLVQKDLAEFLNVSVSTVSNYEVERHYPDAYTLVKLADFFDVNLDYLLGRTKIKFKWHELELPIDCSHGTEVRPEELLYIYSNFPKDKKAAIADSILSYKTNSKYESNI